MAKLFDVNIGRISRHISNVIKESELDDSTTEESSVVQKDGKREVR